MRYFGVMIIIGVLLSANMLLNGITRLPLQHHIEAFQPTLEQVGLWHSSQQIEWVTTLRNDSKTEGTGLIVTDQFSEDWLVEDVVTSAGTIDMNEQQIQITIETLAPGEVVQFSIFATPPEHQRILTNTICLRADNTRPICSTGELVSTTQTTDPNIWSIPLLILFGAGAFLLLLGTMRPRR